MRMDGLPDDVDDEEVEQDVFEQLFGNHEQPQADQHGENQQLQGQQLENDKDGLPNFEEEEEIEHELFGD